MAGVAIGYQQSEDHVAKRMLSKASTLAARVKPFSKDWLESLYTVEGLDCVQIGKIANRDPKSIWSWLKHYGIPTRPRGSNFSQLPNGRAPGFTISESHKQALREARLADGHKPYMKDGRHWLHHDDAVHPNWKGGISPERQGFYSTDEWREAVKIIWARADAKCERCGKHHNTTEIRGTFHIHHLVSFMVRELRSVPSNLVLLCKPCHLFVHSNANTEKQFLKGF